MKLKLSLKRIFAIYVATRIMDAATTYYALQLPGFYEMSPTLSKLVAVLGAHAAWIGLAYSIPAFWGFYYLAKALKWVFVNVFRWKPDTTPIEYYLAIVTAVTAMAPIWNIITLLRYFGYLPF